MMKKTFIPFAALALLALVSCGGNNSSSSSAAKTSEPATTSAVTSAGTSQGTSEAPSVEPSAEPSVDPSSEAPSEDSSTPVTYSVAIANKEALQAEWHVGDANRAIDLNLDPRTNILAALTDGTLEIVSSDPSVVMISGKNAIAVSVGVATITVIYGDAVDSVQVTVEDALTEPDYAAKSLTEIMAVEDLVQVDKNWYGHAAYLSQVKVGVLGKTADGKNPADKYGNMFVTDPADNSAEPALVQVYGSGVSIDALTYDLAGKIYKYSNKQDFLTNEATKEIKVGDVLDVIVIRADYQSTKEVSMVIRAINGKLVSNGVRTTDQVNATEDSSNVRKQLISVTGKITGWQSGKEDGGQYGNFYLQTEGSETDPVYVYGATASSGAITLNADGSLKFSNPKDFLTNDGTKDLKVGDIITLLGFRCDYNGTLELTGQIVIPEVPEEAIAVDVAKAIEVAGALEAGTTTDKEYAVTGSIFEVIEPFNSTYNNLSFTITDGVGNLFTCFRVAATAESAAELVPGVKVTVTAKLEKKVNDEIVSLQTAAGGTAVIVKDYVDVVEITHVGTAADPFTIDEAISIIKGWKATETKVGEAEVYVTGVAKSVSYNSKYSSYTIDLDADKLAEGFQFYSCSIASEVDDDFGSDPDRLVGATLTICGYLEAYVKDGATKYEVGYLKAAQSPTQADYTPSIVAISNAKAKPAAYYLVGTFNDWTANASYLFTKMEEQKDNKDQYVLNNVHLEAGCEFKINTSQGGTTTWFPDGVDNNYVITVTGDYNIYFVPEGGIADNGWYEGFFYVDKIEAPVLGNSASVAFAPANIKEYTGNYTKEFEVESEGITYVVNHGNPGQAKDAWGHIRFGHKSNDACKVGTLDTKAAFGAAVASVDFSSSINKHADKMVSIKVIVSADETFDENDSAYSYVVGESGFVQGDLNGTIQISNPVANAFYRFEVTTDVSGGDSGFFRLSGLTFNFAEVIPE